MRAFRELLESRGLVRAKLMGVRAIAKNAEVANAEECLESTRI